MSKSNSTKGYVKIAATHSKSVNVEHSDVQTTNERYVLTARAVETLSRLYECLAADEAGRSFAITGPYGSGKSSFVLFLRQLLQTTKNKAHKQLETEYPDLAAHLLPLIRRISGSKAPFLVGMATAQREPVLASVRKAIENALLNSLVPARLKKSISNPEFTSNEIIGVLKEVLKKNPVLLVIDEFGKNLESFRDKPDESDLFVLQQLAELAQSKTDYPLVLMTLKHLSFSDYSNDLDQSPRRELAKIQGRFEEVMFVEDPSETRRLISQLFTEASAEFVDASRKWEKKNKNGLIESGVSNALDLEIALKVFPLHPTALACLPELCSRFAQNDRTLFAYLGSKDPRSVLSHVETTPWKPGENIPFIRLDHVYDYFVESVSTSISTSDLASRWIEIETRIRDTAGLTELQVKVLKTIGILNLVSAGGLFRASKNAVAFALKDSVYGAGTARDIVDAIEGNSEKNVKGLIEMGILVYREFADEFRIWLGTDFPIQEKMQTHRFDARKMDMAELMNIASPLTPVVASRHSQMTGVLRIFDRRFLKPESLHNLEQLEEESTDGHLVLLVGANNLGAECSVETDRPVVVSVPTTIDAAYEIAVEVYALKKVAQEAEALNADRTARREIAERLSLVQTRLLSIVEETWSPRNALFVHVGGDQIHNASAQNVSRVLSDICDKVYSNCPEIRNEMISRRDVTGQGARARRLLSEAMILNTNKEYFGIEGFGPERAMYDAVFRHSRFHSADKTSSFLLNIPKNRENKWTPILKKIGAMFDSSSEERLSLGVACNVLQRPPFGLKMGLIPLLILAEIVRRKDDVLVYEHGSLVTEVDDAIAERLIKNPNHFSVKVLRQSSESEAMLQLYAKELFQDRADVLPSVVAIGKKMYAEVRSLSRYPLVTEDGISKEALVIRQRIKEATELDVLLLQMLPQAVDCAGFGLGKIDKNITGTIQRIAEHYNILINAYPAMLSRAQGVIAKELGLSPDASVAMIRKNTASRAAAILKSSIDPNLNALASALESERDDHAWIEHVAYVLSGGKSPHGWDDDQFNLFCLSAKNFVGRFKRLAELASSGAEAHDANSESVLVSVTSTDGTELRERYFLSEGESQLRTEIVQSAIGELLKSGLSKSDASAALVAELIRVWRDQE